VLPVLVLLVVAYFYYRPIASWMHTRDALARREAQVAALQRQKAEFEQAVARATTLSALTRRARRIGLVHQGEQLFIVKGIPAWRRAHSHAK
jgi:chorismate-pyruvate lyase